MSARASGIVQLLGAAAAAIIASGTVASAAGAAAAGSAAGHSQQCARAAALLRAGYLPEALTAYKADLGKGECAIQGVGLVNAELAKQANLKALSATRTPSS